MLFAAPNQRSTLVSPVEPWSLDLPIPPEARVDKAAFGKWAAEPSTEYCFFSGSEALNPAIRVSKTNPLKSLHCLIADYDCAVVPGADAQVLASAPVELRPTWMSRTFSGGRRLLWLFERPVALSGGIAKPFLAIAKDALKLKKLLPGLDEPAWLDLAKLYALGDGWEKLSDTPISINALHYFLFEAAKKTKWETDIRIPLDVVADEVEKRYPNRWDGPFEEGKRGVVFFNPGSANPSASIVAQEGLICFGEEKTFYSWPELFPDLARRYAQDKIGGAIEGVYFDGSNYYRKIDGVWQRVAKEDFVKYLCAMKGLDSGKGKGETASETTRAEVFVQLNRRVAGVVPRVFDPRDVVEINGQRFLNIAYVRPMQPADESQAWSENFPWCARFLETRFDDYERDVLLAWWRRFYASALAGDLLPGHALFLVGSVNLGKTLISNKIIGASVGGFADASSHISKDSEFNRELVGCALWCLDDGQVAADPVSHRKFSEAVKRVVATPTVVYRAMRQDGQSTLHNGRLLITLNDDTYSMQMIPDLQTSMEEKVVVLRFRDGTFPTPPASCAHAARPYENAIAAELPFLLRWLLDWSPPAEIVGDDRLGVHSYINADMRAKALYSGDVGDLLELVGLFVKSLPPEEGDWIGTASDFYSQATRWDDTKMLVSKYSPRVIGRRFSEAARIRDSGISLADEDKKRGNKYRILKPERTDGKAVRIKPEVAG